LYKIRDFISTKYFNWANDREAVEYE
jgi:hypothetical protein